MKYSFLSCEKSCKSNQKCILCDVCNKWIHFRCTNLSLNGFLSLGVFNLPYLCLNCIGDIFSFHALSNDDFNKLHHFHYQIVLYCIVFLFGVSHNKYDSQK